MISTVEVVPVRFCQFVVSPKLFSNACFAVTYGPRVSDAIGRECQRWLVVEAVVKQPLPRASAAGDYLKPLRIAAI